MTKSEFIQQLSSGYSEGMLVETVETVMVGVEAHSVFGTYDFADMQSLSDFFSLNYSDEMVRTNHGTKILSFSLKQREE
jgi:hypothetical protein